MPEQPNKMIRVPSHKTVEDGFSYEPPARCHYCEQDLRPTEWPDGSFGPYITIRMPIPGIALYQCTKCSHIMGNIYAAENLQRLKKLQNEATILQPPESRIIKLSS